MGCDVILTGIPRSGTTLTAALVDNLPETVCLNEPGWQGADAAQNAEGFARFVKKDFANLRKHLLMQKPIPDRRANDGAAITNYYKTDDSGQMHNQFQLVPLTRSGLTPNFTLAVKHNGPYLAVLPELLAESFKVIAVIRDPLPVIRSWRRLALPISRGDLPNAKRYWPELKAITDGGDDLLVKQVRIYELMLERILHYAPQMTLLRYEDIIENPALIAGALGHADTTLPALVEKQPMQAGKEDDQINDALKIYARLACGLWPR